MKEGHQMLNVYRCLKISLLVLLISSVAGAEETQTSPQTKEQKRTRSKVASKQRPARSGISAAQVLATRFDRAAPQIGDPLPDVTGLDAEGHEFPLRNLKGHYTVLTFGCLT